MGLDSDDPRSLGEVGRLGVAVDSIDDMETLFDGIDLAEVSVSMTINAPAIIIMAYFLANAKRRGVDWKLLRGTIQNDILKEFSRPERDRLSARTVRAARMRPDRILCHGGAAMEHRVDQRLPHPRGRLDGGCRKLAFTLADGFPLCRSMPRTRHAH